MNVPNFSDMSAPLRIGAAPSRASTSSPPKPPSPHGVNSGPPARPRLSFLRLPDTGPEAADGQRGGIPGPPSAPATSPPGGRTPLALDAAGEQPAGEVALEGQEHDQR